MRICRHAPSSAACPSHFGRFHFYFCCISECAHIAETPVKSRFFEPQEHSDYDLGTEELAHLEIVGSIVRQLMKNATTEEIENSPFGAYFINSGRGVFPANSSGMPFDANCIAVTGDPIADLTEDLAAEQKARAVYDNILRVSDDPDVSDVIKFLREREIVHFQRFGEAKLAI